MKQNKLFTLFSLTLLSTGTPLTSIVQAGTIINDAPAITAASNNDTKIVNKKETKSEATDEQKAEKQETKQSSTDDKKNKTTASSTKQVNFEAATTENLKSEMLKSETLVWGDAPWVFDADSGILVIGAGQLNDSNSPWSRADDKAIKADGIKKIIFVGDAQAPSDSSNIFRGLSSLTEFVGLDKLDTSKVTDMAGMFARTVALTNLDLSSFDTSKVKTTVDMFEGCTSLTSLDLSRFDTSSLTNMGGMFKNCSSLKNLDLSSFNTSEVTTMRDMFSNTPLFSLTLGDNFRSLGEDCKLTLDYPSDALREGKYVTGNWTNKDNNAVSYTPADFIANYGKNDLKAGTYVAETKPLVWGDANWAFDTDTGVLTIGSGQLKEVKDSPWNRDDNKKIDKKQIKKISFTGVTKAPVNSSKLFKKLTNLTEIENLTNLDTSEVTDMSEMFYDCYDLTKLDLSNFNTTNVNTISYMFFFCRNLTELDLSKFNTQNITDMGSVFQECGSLKSLDLSRFETSKVTTMNKMFQNTSLSTLTLGNKFKFIESDSKLPVPTALTPGDQLTGKWIKKNRGSFAHSPTGFMREYGKNDLSAGTYVAEIKEDRLWGDAPWSFDGDSGTLTIESGRIDNSSNSPWNRKDDKGIDKKLIKKIIFTGTILAPSNSRNLFANLKSLTEIVGLGELDTSNVTEMSRMFGGSSALTSLDLSQLDTSKVKSTVAMFSGATSLTNLNLSRFDTSSLTNMGAMFSGCSSLESLDLSSFNTSKVTTMRGMFSGTTLSSLTLGDKFKDLGDDAELSAPGALKEGDDLTGNWIRQDGNSYGYNAKDFMAKFGKDLKSGTYVAETKALKWGDAACSFNADSGVLMVGPGRLSTNSYSPWNKTTGKAIDKQLIKKIIFTGEIQAPGDSVNLFANLKSLTEIVGLEKMDTSKVRTTVAMFKGCTALASLNLSNFDTSNVVNMGVMFKGCSSLKSLDLSSFNTSNVTTMREIFIGTRLSSLTLGDKVKDLGNDAELSAPSALTPGDDLTGNWIRQDGNSKAYSPKDFMAKYGTEDLKSGTYIAETK